MKTVTKDCGSYQTVMEEVPCAAPAAPACGCATPAPACGCAAAPACAPAPATRTVCKKFGFQTLSQRKFLAQPCNDKFPKKATPIMSLSIATKFRQSTVKKCRMKTETKTRMATRSVMVPETKTVTVKQAKTVQEQLVRDVTKTVCETQTKTGVRNVTEYVDEQKTVEYTVNVMVPETRPARTMSRFTTAFQKPRLVRTTSPLAKPSPNKRPVLTTFRSTTRLKK